MARAREFFANFAGNKQMHMKTIDDIRTLIAED